MATAQELFSNLKKNKKTNILANLPPSWKDLGIFEKISRTAKEIPGVFLSSEKGFGESIASAIVAPGVAKSQKETAQSSSNIQSGLIQKYKQATDANEKERLKKALINAGVDIRRLTGVEKLAEVAPAVNKSAKQIYGEAAGVAVDILSFGQYGQAAKGAKSFQLLKVLPKSAPAIQGAKTATQAFIQGAKKVAPRAFLEGFGYGATQAMMDDKEWKEIAGDGLKSGMLSVVFSGAFAGLESRQRYLAPQKADAMRKKAIKLYQSGLETTKEKYKAKAEKIIPELLDNNWWGNKKKLLKKAQEGIALSSKEYSQLGELQGVAEVDGLLSMISKEMDKLKTPSGRVVSTNTTKYKALENLMDDILSLRQMIGANSIANQQSLRELAQQYGGILYETRRSIKTIGDNATLSQVKKVDSAIRSILNAKNPEYEKINELNHMSKELYEILQETTKRKGGQKWLSLTNSIISTIGGVVGTGAPGIVDNIVVPITLVGLANALESTWFKTMLAKNKWKLANKLMKVSKAELPHILTLIATRGEQFVNELLLGD